MTRALTRDQVREVDRIAIEELGISGPVLMENAARNAVDALEAVLGRTRSARVVIFAGPGNNGGDGFAMARHLTNRGREVAVFLAGDPAKLSPDAKLNCEIVQRMGLAVGSAATAQQVQAALGTLKPDDVVVDALLGTGFRGEVREPLAALIRGINEAPRAFVLAVDVPSGLDCDTGQPCNATIRADLTVTFVAAKAGFAEAGAAAWTGPVEVVDIGAPPALIDRVTTR